MGQLTRLRQTDHQIAIPVADAIDQWLRGIQTGTNATLIARIEAHRQDLLTQHQPLHEISPGFNDGDTIARACRASKSRAWCELLYLLIRALRPATMVELGTNLGISAAYEALAARDYGGHLVTLDGSPARVELAMRFHRDLDLMNISYSTGLFAGTLRPVVTEQGVIDFAFIDGHHQKQPTLDYFETIYPHLGEHAVIVFDDIRWSEGMREAWRTLVRDPRFALVLDLLQMGICVAGGTITTARPLVFHVLSPSRWRRRAHSTTEPSRSGRS